MNDQSIEDYFQDFRRELKAESYSQYMQTEFMEKVARELDEVGAINEFIALHYRDRVRGLQIDGYSPFTDDDALNLFVADFRGRDELETLTRTEVSNLFKRSEKFFEESRGDLQTKVEESADCYRLTEEIAAKKEIRQVNFYLFSERQLSRRVKDIEESSVAGIPCTYHVWDMSRLHRQSASKGQKESLDLDFLEMFGHGLPCLKAHLGEDNFPSYLVVIPGADIAHLYGLHGSRLLEQNVRSFLQTRGNVNKGIRSTILGEPDMFFAYNNGISATAQEIETQAGDGASQEIIRIKDLQIVNGGQTTASLFHASYKDKVSLDKIFVQMKLVVIDEGNGEYSEEIVPRISEYANTQNRINAADFFSNHPFHVRMQEFSRRIWAPAKQGSQQETKWFYERARGQYADAQSKMTPAQRRGFQMHHPKAQMFTKTDLAKFENVWDEPPKWVNLGAQKNFSKYAERIGKEWQKSNAKFNEFYFRRAVARGIIFRHTEKLVSDQDWYQGGYRANIVAYAIGCLAEICRKEDKIVNSEEIWRKQDVPRSLSQALVVSARFANDYIIAPAEGYSNISEWAKKDYCWNKMQQGLSRLKSELPKDFEEILILPDKEKKIAKEARNNQKVDDSFEAQIKIVKIPYNHWIQILDLDQEKGFLDSKKRGVLEQSLKLLKARKPPSEKQSLVLLDVLQKGKEEGILLPKKSVL